MVIAFIADCSTVSVSCNIFYKVAVGNVTKGTFSICSVTIIDSTTKPSNIVGKVTVVYYTIGHAFVFITLAISDSATATLGSVVFEAGVIYNTLGLGIVVDSSTISTCIVFYKLGISNLTFRIGIVDCTAATKVAAFSIVVYEGTIVYFTIGSYNFKFIIIIEVGVTIVVDCTTAFSDVFCKVTVCNVSRTVIVVDGRSFFSMIVYEVRA